MSEDTSNLQVIEKFSFIYTLTHSRNKTTRQLAKKVAVDIEKSTDKPHHEPCRQLVHSPSSDSVTISSILGFPHLAANNGASLGLLDESIDRYTLDLPEHLKSSSEDDRSSRFIFRHLGKIVFVLSSGYFIFVACWLAGHNYYGQLFPFSALRTILNSSEQQISAADLEFIDYMERSLASIERDLETELNNSATQPENSDVVYIPVYNLTNVNSASKTHNPETTLPLNSSANNSPLPIPVIPPPPPIKAPRSTVPSTSTKTTSPTATSPSPVNINSNPTPSPVKDYTLLGIVELGKRSAALFKVDGVTKRVWVGEKLDRKGWVLDSVVDQKAKIVRQGKIRYLSVGEKF